MSRTTLLRLPVRLLVALLSHSAILSAQTPDTTKASAHFDRAVSLLEQNDLAGAANELERAHELKPNPQVIYNLAQVYAELGRLAEAYNTFQIYLKQPGDVAPERLEAVAEETERLRPKVAILSFAVRPPEGTALVDGATVAQQAAEAGLAVTPGQHDIVVKANGHTEERFTVDLKPGADAIVRISLVPERPSEVAPSPAPPRSEPSQPRVAPAVPSADPNTDRVRTHKGLEITVLGGGLALGAAATVLYVVSERKTEDTLRDSRMLEADRATDPTDPSLTERSQELNRRTDTVERLDAASALLAGAGVATLVAGTTLWLTRANRSSKQRNAPRLTGGATPTVQGGIRAEARLTW